ncbi:MAG: hypothetical protein FJZ47_13730 [Candidatus Tectomicrobia bacterium]|uniref:Uncharacterized protein n=1 Tax=Tectimicrobiota bacterium TaxID=2528274 RepID=A0A938B3A5_UNCTE|nr:hypothetical protein [Candidatus Tectomicrobia bacterium]
MVLFLLGHARRRWLVYLMCCLSLSSCSPAYQFRYQYTMIPPTDASDGIENAQVRVRVVPMDDLGVLQLAVLNKSPQPITIVWNQTRYVDPLGQPRPAIDASPSGLFGPPGWPAGGTRLVPGETFQTTIRPGGFRAVRQPGLSPYAGQPDLRLPPDPEFQSSGRPTERVSLNPFTVSRSTGGEVSVSTRPQPLLPTAGDTPTLGQAYKGREFRFILALLLDTGVRPYTFTFRITDVEVQQGSASAS